MPIFGPKQGTAFTFYLPVLQAGTRTWLASPDIGYSSAMISKNGGTEAASTNALELSPAGGYWIKISLTATEMTSPVVQVRLHDASGTWDDTGEIIFTTSQGSGSGVVATISTTAFIDPVELANDLVGPLSNVLVNTLNFFTSTEMQQVRYALGLSGTTAATSGTGVLDLVYDAVQTLGFTGSNVNASIASISSSALASIAAEIFSMLSDTNKRFSELSAAPSATPTVAEALMALFMALRNGGVQSSTQRTFRNTSNSTIATQSITDNGTSVTIGKWT